MAAVTTRSHGIRNTSGSAGAASSTASAVYRTSIITHASASGEPCVGDQQRTVPQTTSAGLARKLSKRLMVLLDSGILARPASEPSLEQLQSEAH